MKQSTGIITIILFGCLVNLIIGLPNRDLAVTNSGSTEADDDGDDLDADMGIDKPGGDMGVDKPGADIIDDDEDPITIDVGVDKPGAVIVPDDGDPETDTSSTLISDTRVTECAEGKCTTCVNGECREHPMDEIKIPTLPDLSKNMPNIAEFCKAGVCRTCIDGECFETTIDDKTGIRTGKVDVVTGPDGSRTLTKTETETKIIRCDQNGCESCVDDKCTKIDKDDMSNMGMIDNGESTDLSIPGIKDISFGQSISVNCDGGECKICEDGVCKNVTTGASRRVIKIGGCPEAICTSGCEGFVFQDVKGKPGTKCPICKCKDRGTREACEKNDDCETKKCEDNLCSYPIPKGPVQDTCVFTSYCPSDQICKQGFCQKPSSDSDEKRKHFQGKTCSFDFQCPSGYGCGGGTFTCWEDPENIHIEGKTCMFGPECPEGHYCNVFTCYKGERKTAKKGTEKPTTDRRSAATDGPQTDKKPKFETCESTTDCKPGFECRATYCLPEGSSLL